MSDDSHSESLMQSMEPSELYNEVEWPTAIAALKADADAALEAGRPVTAGAIRNEARELEARRDRLHKAMLAARDQQPS